jgi:DNA-binding HxlR family transcriptional regulator
MSSPEGEGQRFSERRAAPRPPAHRQWTPLGRALTAIGDKWTLAIVCELAPGRMRLSQLRERLGVGSAVLDRYLQQMLALGVVERSRFREMPPRVEVELTEAGRELLPVAVELARWGMRRAWSAPQPDEHVDLAALLRMLPLVARSRLPDGVIELIVEDAQEPLNERLRIQAGEVSSGAGEARRSQRSARVAGPRGAWIAALTAGDDCQLTVSGDSELASALLAAVVVSG